MGLDSYFYSSEIKGEMLYMSKCYPIHDWFVALLPDSDEGKKYDDVDSYTLSNDDLDELIRKLSNDEFESEGYDYNDLYDKLLGKLVKAKAKGSTIRYSGNC
jgi:hypothetical protein